VSDNGRDTVFTIGNVRFPDAGVEHVFLKSFSGEDFEEGLRFDSEAEINALSQRLYGYDAIIP
jgi:hypothetical protein